MTARFETGDVERYYERHTRAFVEHGQGEGSIHRAVWGPGVVDRQHAFHYVEDRIADLIRPLADRAAAGGSEDPPLPRSTQARTDVEAGLQARLQPHVVDLGCGVGASLCYLAQQLPIRATGITISPTQATLARERVAEADLSKRVECLQGDYCDLPSRIADVDLAFAIEAFVHGPSPETFFSQCHRLIKPGGLLAICDDVRRESTDPEAAHTIDTFMRGWHINSLLRREELLALANGAGFTHESTSDLTPYLELRRLRDRVLAVAMSGLRALRFDTSRYDDIVGGTALQTCLARGWIGYELLVFRRQY